MSQERRSREGNKRNPHRSLWTSHEWDHLSKDDYMTRILLDEHGNGLLQNSEAMSPVSDT